MKIFRIKGHYYTGYVCAESWIQAIDVFKNAYYPVHRYQYDNETKKYLLEQQKNMDISLDPNSEWTVEECDISYPNCLSIEGD